jgi:hypothetical protein
VKGMPEILTWRILGTSLQRTSKVDRSDPTVASAHSRSPSQGCSSHSSPSTKRGSDPEPERLTPPVGTVPCEDEVAAPQDGSRFCAPLLRGIE